MHIRCSMWSGNMLRICFKPVQRRSGVKCATVSNRVAVASAWSAFIFLSPVFLIRQWKIKFRFQNRTPASPKTNSSPGQGNRKKQLRHLMASGGSSMKLACPPFFLPHCLALQVEQYLSRTFITFTKNRHHPQPRYSFTHFATGRYRGSSVGIPRQQHQGVGWSRAGCIRCTLCTLQGDWTGPVPATKVLEEKVEEIVQGLDANCRISWKMGTL